MSEQRRIRPDAKRAVFRADANLRRRQRNIEKKKATYYCIAMSVKRICEAIVRDEKSVLPVSSMQTGEESNGVSLSMPAIIGKHSVEGAVSIELNDKEKAALKASAETPKTVITDVLGE